MNARLRFVLDALALLVSKAAFIGLRLSALYLIARRVDSQAFGAIALTFTISEIARVLGDWGCDTLSLRKFSDPDRRLAISTFRWVVRLRVAASLVAMSVAIGAAMIFSKLDSLPLLLLISATAATSLWLNLGVNWLQARGLLRNVSLLLVGVGLLSLIAQVVIVQQGATLEAQLGALLLGECVMAALVLALAAKAAKGDSIRNLPGQLRGWLAEATPIAWAALLAMLYTRFDQFFIAHFGTGATLGEYTLAARVLEPCAFVAAAFSSTIYARASGVILGSVNTEAARAVARRALGKMLSLGGVMAASVLVFAVFLLPRWLPGFPGATVLVCIGAVMLVFRCANLCLTALIQATGGYRQMLGVAKFNAVLVLVSVVIGERLGGAAGVAAGMALAEGTNTCIQVGIFRRLYADVPSQ